MGFFSNAAESFLPDRDYLPLAMPTTDLRLLDVLTRGGGVLRRYSALPNVVIAPQEVTYTTVLDAPVADASGGGTRKAKVGIGLGIVSSIVKALGADAEVNLSVSRAHTVEFAYTGVRADRVDIATLDTWLTSCDLNPLQRNVAELIVAERLYVVVGALKASGVRVTFLDESEHELSVDVPLVQEVVGTNVTVSGSSSRNGTVTFTGNIPLTVAAKAALLTADDNGLWVGERPVTRGEIRKILADASPSYLSGEYLRLG